MRRAPRGIRISRPGRVLDLLHLGGPRPQFLQNQLNRLELRVPAGSERRHKDDVGRFGDNNITQSDQRGDWQVALLFRAKCEMLCAARCPLPL
jgi:hypothetical protein